MTRARAHAQILLACLFVAGLGIRTYHLQDPPLDFHPTRQYHSAVIARGCYDRAAAGRSDRARRIAIANGASRPVIEPRIMEFLACGAYRAIGEEQLWIPRFFSSLFWVIGAAGLSLLAVRTGSPVGALVAVAFYLFVPFGIVASRSFQPDPLMVMAIVWAAVAIVRHHESPTPGRLLIAEIAAGLAAFVKPVSLFFTTGAYVGLAASGKKPIRSVLSRQSLVFLLLSLLPVAVYLGYGTYVAGFLTGQSEGRILPRLLGSAFFWAGWLFQIRYAIGLVALVGAALGLVLAPPGLYRGLLGGLWGGYVLFALVFTYHAATHNYYHLPFIPIVALSVGSLVAWVEARLPGGRVRQVGIWGIEALLVVGALASLDAASRTQGHSTTPVEAAMYERLGRLVGHSTRVVMLDPDYGLAFMYHGEVSGAVWPSGGDLYVDVLMGRERPDAETRFRTQYLPGGPEFFVITDFRSMAEQPDLKAFLDRNFRILAEDYNYVVYDLRRWNGGP